MKVLFVVNSLQAGGAEKQTIQLCKKFSSEGWDVTCLYLSGKRYDLEFELITPASKRYKTVSVVNFLAKNLKANEYDLVICVNQYPLFVTYLARMLVGKRVPICEIFHTTELKNTYEKIKMKVYGWLFERVNHVIFVSLNQSRYWLNKITVKNYSIIQNGINITDSPIEDIEIDEKFHFGINAMLRPEKNHLFLLVVFSLLLKQSKKSIHLNIIGSGPMEKAITKRVEELGLLPHVSLHGFISDPSKLINKCDCMLLVSNSVETFSLSNLESMLLAKPIISSDIGGANEQIIHGKTGFLFNNNDSNDLLKFMKYCVDDKSMCIQMGKKARELLLANFTEEIMFDKYRKTFKRFEKIKGERVAS